MAGGFDVSTAIQDAAHQYGVDPAFALRVAHAESALNPAAVSPKGALGVMQLMPGTASDMGVDPHDVRQNIVGGVKYLRQLSDKYDGDHELMAAAYNAGPGAVDKHGGVPPFPETQAYVAKVANDPVPTADDLEKHFAAGPGPVEQKDLPQVPGYIGDPQNPEGGGVWGTKGIPIGGPSADDLEKHFGGTPPSATKPPSPQQQAARRDLEPLNTALGQGLHVALHGPYGVGDTDTETPAIHGFSQGFSDEVAGRVAGLATGAKNLALDALGKPIPYGMKDAEAAQTAISREKLAKIAQEHPVASAAAEIGGGVLPWLAGGELIGAGKAVTAAPNAMRGVAQLGGRIITGAAKGGALGATGGAVTGFGNAEGTVEQRLPGAEGGAVTGAVLGSALGAGAPVVAPIAAKAASYVGDELSAAGGAIKQGVSNALEGLHGRPVETTAREYFAARSPTAQKVQGTFASPEVAETVEPTEHETRLAQTRVAQMMAAKGMHPDDLRAIPQDIPHTTAEAIGSQTVNHLASLARRAGTTPDIAASQIAQRAEDFAPSVMDDFAAAAKIDPRQARVLNEDVTGTIHKDEVTPAYQAALDVDNPKPVMSVRLAKLQEDPDVQSALDQASRLVAKSGRATSMVGPKIDPDTGAPVINPTTQEPVLEHQPTAEVWDMTKKLVDKMIVRQHGVVVDSGPDGVKNVFLKHASEDVRGALKEAIPGYDKALASASDELSRKAAYKLGSKTLFDQSSAKDFTDARAKMSPDELEAHTAGVANALFDKAQKGLLRPAALKTPLFQAKVRAVLGEEADTFLARLEQRARLHATGGRIMPGTGSQTAPLLQAEAESAPVVDALGNIVKGAIHAKASPGTFLAKHVLTKAIGDRASNVAETPGYRNAYGRILLQHPRETADELRNAPPIKPRLLTAHKVPVGALGGNVAGQTSRPGQ